MPTTNPVSIPPFNPEDLVHRRVVEGHRVEFKADWNEPIKAGVLRTVCAFANDLLNLNGGYIILGIEETGGRPELPPRGLGKQDLERIQKEIYGVCTLIQPQYQPYLYPLEFQGEPILIIWAPGGSTRPYLAPEDITRKGSRRSHFIRHGPQSVRAQGEFLNQLMSFAAKVPFDDQRSLKGSLEDISPTLVRRFLHEVGSTLAKAEPPVGDGDLFRKLRLVVPINAHEVPINAALIFFSEHPERFFPGAQIDVVVFSEGAGGNLIAEEIYTGPLPHQVRMALNHVKGLIPTRIRKVPDRPEAERSEAYPFVAVEEALINAVYHRAYNGDPEPIKVCLYPDRMEITSYPGPPAGLEKAHFMPGATVPLVSRRNRRIGDFLKEIQLAEARSTGIGKIHSAMRHNGSPDAIFDFAEKTRTYFRVILPIHPEHRADTPALGNEKSRAPGSSRVELASLLIVDIVDSTNLVKTIGDSRFLRILREADQIVQDMARTCQGRVADRTDGFLLMFRRPIHAVLFALDYHRAIEELARDQEISLTVRMGIHLGEVTLIETDSKYVQEGTRQTEVEGIAKAVTSRLTSLAMGRQILISKPAFDLARGATANESLPDETKWLYHGLYELKGVSESTEVCEVGLDGFAPLTPPPDTEKAKRVKDKGSVR